MTTQTADPQLQTDLSSLFEAQRRHAPLIARTSAEERIGKLKRLRAYVMDHLEEIKGAMYADFRKPGAEALLGEVYALSGEIKHTIRHLKQWMRPQRVPTSLSLVGTTSQIVYEPKGNTLIISPWNYPFALAVKPLVSAIAAGNVAIIKPSELTPHTAAQVRKLVEALFPPEEVAVVEGDASVAQALLDLPFNHIFFTGSPAVGKVVMTAAAKHLASVTLELGGKSPCIVDETADLATTAEKVAWGKSINNGQTCIAPDYVLVHERVKDGFVQAYQAAVRRMYDPEGRGVEHSASYARIVNQRHFQRVKALLDDAVQKGARVSHGGRTIESEQFMEPTVLEGVTDSMKVMQEEIFGPLLPIVPYRDSEEVIQMVNSREKPLALYINSRNEANIRYFLERTSAGDTVINDVLLQFGNPELPFGGVNNSGLGKSNGFFGFQEFSNARGVMRRQFGTMKFIYPPYTEKVERLIRFLSQYL